jgi:hypothetical protein
MIEEIKMDDIITMDDVIDIDEKITNNVDEKYIKKINKILYGVVSNFQKNRIREKYIYMMKTIYKNKDRGLWDEYIYMNMFVIKNMLTEFMDNDDIKIWEDYFIECFMDNQYHKFNENSLFHIRYVFERVNKISKEYKKVFTE